MEACSSATSANLGRVVGANDIVLVDRILGDGSRPPDSLNRYLFVTSTDTNELRVLDLRCPANNATNPSARCYASAPNPLETLSIPVLERPTSLALDERYVDGVRTKGSLLYATRPGGTEVSIVGVSDDEFREVRRLPIPAPVTALTALMADAQTSRLWVATFDGRLAVVWEVTMPSTPAALRRLPTVELAARAVSRFQLRDESIVALLAIPGLVGRAANGRPFCADPTEVCLVLSSRRLAGADGTTLMVDLKTLETVPLKFPGPVRQLATSDQTPAGTPLGDQQRAIQPPPGALVFGLLDEEACGDIRCSGISAVDTRGPASGVFSVVRSEGVETIPLRWNSGLIVGMSLAPSVRAPSLVSGVLSNAEPIPLLGVATTSTGEVFFFDAVRQQMLLQAEVFPYTFSGRFEPGLALPDGGPQTSTYVGGPVLVDGGIPVASGGGFDVNFDVTLRPGGVRSQQVAVVWQGELTPAGGVMAGDVSTLVVDASRATAIQPGDSVTFTQCSSPGRVERVVGGLVFVSGATGCSGTGRAVVAAGAQAPWVVVGSVDGLMGRAAPGGRLEYAAPPALRVPGVNPTGPQMVIPFAPLSDIGPPQRDWLWTFAIESGLAPLVSQVDPSSFAFSGACPSQLNLPGAVVIDASRERVFAAYPSSNVVVEMDPLRINRGALGPNNGVLCHR
jgi:hypothetical protein